jgi:hypothetical protein
MRPNAGAAPPALSAVPARAALSTVPARAAPPAQAAPHPPPGVPARTAGQVAAPGGWAPRPPGVPGPWEIAPAGHAGQAAAPGSWAPRPPGAPGPWEIAPAGHAGAVAAPGAWEPSPSGVPGAWEILRAAVTRRLAVAWVPLAAAAGACPCCYGPLRPGNARCFQCDLHTQTAPGLLADLVAPAAYAPKGGELARALWLYKAGRPGSGQAGAALLALLLLHLHERVPAAWRSAGLGHPTHACVVPSGRGRPGPHPLRALAAGYLGLPWVTLLATAGGDPWARDLDPDRFTVRASLAGARVLLLDDTWTSGASAQSACVALKRAGAGWVSVVVLGRHLGPAAPAARTRVKAACPPSRPPAAHASSQRAAPR